MSDKTIVFSLHARAKFEILRNHGLDISEAKIAVIANNPDTVYQGYSPSTLQRGSDMRKVKYSKDVDALLIELSDKPVDYAEEAGQFIVHFDKEGQPVLLEILDAKNFLLGSLSSLMKETEASLP